MAVDAYCLLHRGSYGCARELVEGEPTDRHVAYCMGRIDLLLAAGVRPLVVFDGGRLPNKAEEERARERNREESKARARGLWAQGNKAAALECYQRAVDIQPAHAKQFVEVGACLGGGWGGSGRSCGGGWVLPCTDSQLHSLRLRTTPQPLFSLQALKRRGVPFIVAPYEADAQVR